MLNFAAGLHTAAAGSTGFTAEYPVGANPMLHELAVEDVTVVDGMNAVPDGPGLGLTIDQDFVKATRMESLAAGSSPIRRQPGAPQRRHGRNKHDNSADAAKQVIASAETKATEMGVAIAIVVLDDAGHLKGMLRMDGAPFPSIGVATDKAYTAAGFGLSTDQWYDVVKDEPLLLHGVGFIDGFTMIGGYPLQHDDQMIGAIGARAGSYQQDMEVAQAGVAALG
jgi:uncharacterized protein GlcG (DUF336 family)